MIRLKLLLESNSMMDEFETTPLLQFVQKNSPIKESESSITPTQARPLSDPEFDTHVSGKKNDPTMPFVHSRNITPKREEDIALVDADTEKVIPHAVYKKLIKTRPPHILQRNKKMRHSGDGKANFFNIGLPALQGLIVDERTDEFKVITTCVGAGKCALFCYVKSEQSLYIKNNQPSLYQTRLLNYLINDPQGCEEQLTREIQSKLDGSTRTGKKLVIRWHDSGDFFSPDYEKFAYRIAEKFPSVKFYAYTKMASVAKGPRPSNFFARFSKGASMAQEKQIDFENSLFADIVPKEIFRDLFNSPRYGGKIKKTEFIGVLKQKVADYFKIDRNSILTYRELMAIPETPNPIYNVIVMGGDGDDAALRSDVKAVYLLAH